MSFTIVTNMQSMEYFKKSKYFKKNLGLATTMIDNSGERRPNTNDKFAYYYNTLYKTTIYAQGQIGDIKFYVDHHIMEPVLALYSNEEEFVFDIDKQIITEKGIDFFIGHLLKKMDVEFKDRLAKAKVEEEKKKEKVGNPDAIFSNPGMVSYDDLKAYLDQKNKNRFV